MFVTANPHIWPYEVPIYTLLYTYPYRNSNYIVYYKIHPKCASSDPENKLLIWGYVK